MRKLTSHQKSLLMEIAATGGVSEQDAEYVLNAARSIASTRARGLDLCTEAERAKAIARGHLIGLRHEAFAVILLNCRHSVIRVDTLFTGTIDGAPAYPREIVRHALLHDAAAVILMHNHPSGVAEPSNADVRLTARVRDALALMEIRTLDHLIVANTEVCSFAERGLI